MIRNKTRKTILCRKTEIAGSFYKKAKGLMFRKDLERDSGMLFIFSNPGRPSFWTPFMRFPIDIVFIDSAKRVVDIRENLKPWHAYSPKARAKYALELRAGRARETRTGIGDLLEFSFSQSLIRRKTKFYPWIGSFPKPWALQSLPWH